MRQAKFPLAAVLALNPAAAAQQIVLAIRTATVTQRVTATGGVVPTCAGCTPVPTIQLPAVTGGPIRVQIEAPECHRCGCNTYTQIVKFTTEHDAFCPTGITRQTYECTETYKGIPTVPTLLSLSADLPLGFTRDIQVCNTCGPTPITATITRPITEPQGSPINVSTSGSGSGSSPGFSSDLGSGSSSGSIGSGSGSSSNPIESGSGSSSGSGSGSSAGAGSGSSAGPGSGSNGGPNARASICEHITPNSIISVRLNDANNKHS
ncbi:uncharacterized protein GLRG_08505 [Colletotrichum graminicola M1.001]|uniref:Uncharacterized protein n=1 Tax=Colletotrichum graminicola (strain M1.001 / M2 / FGSC 10212) TaxID=645133 RepID=E3QRT8_COLGM|nr:uncharacterized protein GLRG_08505 [Colletotrichum graminicola M1.001]EFQ33576.1 hypothetical protein GLRG_08505 [Colletotrichum graminicola M1.001]